MRQNNVLLTGTLRAGTTLSCHILNKLPNTVALHEPMRVRTFVELKDPQTKCDVVEEFCKKQRRLLRRQQVAQTKSVDGKVPENSVGDELTGDNLRMSAATRNRVVIDKALTREFTLILKHNSAFTATLDALTQRFPVYAMVRNPLATIASWSSVNFRVQSGHAPAAERADPRLQAELAAISDTLDRQIALINWFYAQYLEHLPPEAIIRYEDLVASRGKALSVIVPDAAELDEPLVSQNASTKYDFERMLVIGERLLQAKGPIWTVYSQESVRQLLGELEHATSN